MPSGESVEVARARQCYLAPHALPHAIFSQGVTCGHQRAVDHEVLVQKQRRGVTCPRTTAPRPSLPRGTRIWRWSSKATACTDSQALLRPLANGWTAQGRQHLRIEDLAAVGLLGQLTSILVARERCTQKVCMAEVLAHVVPDIVCTQPYATLRNRAALTWAALGSAANLLEELFGTTMRQVRKSVADNYDTNAWRRREQSQRASTRETIEYDRAERAHGGRRGRQLERDNVGKVSESQTNPHISRRKRLVTDIHNMPRLAGLSKLSTTALRKAGKALRPSC